MKCGAMTTWQYFLLDDTDAQRPANNWKLQNKHQLASRRSGWQRLTQGINCSSPLLEPSDQTLHLWMDAFLKVMRTWWTSFTGTFGMQELPHSRFLYPTLCFCLQCRSWRPLAFLKIFLVLYLNKDRHGVMYDLLLLGLCCFKSLLTSFYPIWRLALQMSGLWMMWWVAQFKP